jgi:capsular exopolysaccharide synthesis family protein
MVTSALPKEGKSFITANLGISLAHGMDQHALLVDCDLRKPVLAKMFGLDNKVGLVDYLSGDAALSELIVKTPVETLSVLTSGKTPANPAELLGSIKMSALVEELSGRYEDRIIIFDSPPLLVAAETSVLAGQVDAVILVVRQSCSGKAQIQKLIDIIGTERIIGIVFNDQEINPLQKSIVKGYGYYHGGYYHE